MITINQSSSSVFSMPRFIALLKTYLTENAKTLALYTLTLMGISILVGACIGYNCENSINDPMASELIMASYVCTAFVFCNAFSASLMFSSLQTRASRISTFMLPASLLEKYLMRLTVYLVLFAVCYFIAMLCGEVTRLITCDGHCEFMWHYINMLKFRYIVGLIGSMLMYHSIFTLGSSLWPHRSFFKTFVLLVIVGVCITTVTPDSVLTYFRESITKDSWFYIVAHFVLAVVFYYLAWLRFRTTQIVQRFMMD